MINNLKISKSEKDLQNRIKNIVTEYGVCIIENFFNLDDLANLKNELNAILNSDIEKSRDIKTNHTLMKRLSINSTKPFSNIFNFCNFQLFKTLASDFFSTNNNDIKEEVYIHKDKDGADNNVKWHQDPQVSLKFFLYLQDTDENCGAMQYSIGSHSDGIYRLKAARLMGDSNPTLGRTEKSISNKVILKAKGGSLLVFNTAGFHRAGDIKIGKKREVIRVHFSKKYPKSIQLLNRLISIFFISKSLRTKIMANLGFTGAEINPAWFSFLEDKSN